MAKKQPVQGSSREPYKASDFRDGHAQSQYREQSQSQNKDKQEVAHIVSLEVAATALNDYRGPGTPAQSEASDVKKFLNDFSNMRMVDTETNRREHPKLDNALIEKAVTNMQLTAQEEHRALQGAQVVLNHGGELQHGTARCFVNFYSNLITKSGKTVWEKACKDDRKK